MPAKQVFADFVRGNFGGRLALQLFCNCFADELGQPRAASIKTRAQFGFDLHWQPDSDCHDAIILYYKTYYIAKGWQPRKYGRQPWLVSLSARLNSPRGSSPGS